MKLGLKEFTIAAGLLIGACDSKEMSETDVVGDTRSSFAERFPAKSGKPLPTVEDLMQGQLTGDCTSTDQPLVEEQFPMRRGTELVQTLSDGTCLESLEDEIHKESILYVIHGNSKIKFANLTKVQIERVLEAKSFVELQELGIAFVEEYEEEAIKGNTFIGYLTAVGTMTKETKQTGQRILFEGPIEKCPAYRHRRGMGSGMTHSWGTECVWDERQINCPTIIVVHDSTIKRWDAFLTDDEYVLHDTWRGPDYLDAAERPTPQQWLGTQPECPTKGSVVNVDLSQYYYND